ncbi:Mu transposase C-terminal domain-containing protein [Phormidesmis sp. 146-33]
MSDNPLPEPAECPDDAVLLDESSFSSDIDEFVRHLVAQGTCEASKDDLQPWIIQWVADSPDRSTYRNRKWEAIRYLGTPERTFQRWVKNFCEGKELPKKQSRGKNQLTEYWKPEIIRIWEEGNKDGQIKTIQAVLDDLDGKAFHNQEGKEVVSYSTVYRILKPLIAQKELAEGARSSGQGDRCIVNTRDGKALQARWSNEIIQIDSTLIDLFSEYEDDKEVLGYRIIKGKEQEVPPLPGVLRLWLTLAKDVKSTCVLGFLLNAKHPTSDDIALLILRVIRPKNYPPDYELQNVAIPYGRFKHLHTDGGKYLNCDYLHQIGKEVGFTCHLRMKTEDGGDIEAMFNILRYLLCECPGYTNSNTQKRPKGAEERACLKPKDADKILAWFFYEIHNYRICRKHRTMTRYERWIDKLPNTQPPIEVPEEKLTSCMTRAIRRKVQKQGIVSFETRLYQGESLKEHVGQDVLLRLDPDHILHMSAFSLEDDKQGQSLGKVEMLNIEELNEYIEELNLEIPEVSLEKNNLSLDELLEINDAINVKSNQAEASGKPIRLGSRRKIKKRVQKRTEQKSDERRRRRRNQNNELRNDAKQSTKSADESTQPSDNSQNTNKPNLDKVVDFQQQRRKRSIEAFDELLKSDSSEQQIKVTIPRWNDRSH